ncbi:MAG: sensor histidine kinase [Actinomycetota bacterium]
MEIGRERLLRWSLWALPVGFVTADAVGMILTSAGWAELENRFGPVGLAVSLLTSAAFLARRRVPIVVFIGAVVLTPSAATISLATAAMVVCASWAIGAWTERLRVASIVVAGVAALVGIAIAAEDTLVAGIGAAAFIALPAVIGYALRTRRLYVDEVEQRLEAAELRREDRARQAVLAERTRIARELHDVVAHHVSLMGVRAGAARTTLASDPRATEDALVAIEESSRRAVDELRRLLGALRDGDDLAQLGPQPGLGELPSLVDGFVDAGLVVELDVDEDTQVDPMTALTVYRLVEEALTNVTRHSAADRADVHVGLDREEVTVTVIDPGPGATDGRSGTGAGIVGMRERVLLAGGTIEVGPRDAGFAVAVTLPRRRPS